MTDREKPIYLDYNATTPVDERVLEKMLPYFTEHFGNAASKSHAYGWVAEEAVEQAREQVAALLHAEPSEVYFTSGATEALNLALKGLWQRYGSRKGHFITVATEHKAVLDVCQRLEAWGARLTYLPVDSNGGIDLRELERNITGKTLAVVAMYANNETGVIHPIGEIGALAVEHRVFFVTDATQAVGKVPVNVQRDGVHLLALNGHKLYGPKGIGAIYLRRRGPRVQLNPEMDGGGHERGIRSGTVNVPGIVGLGAACALAAEEMPETSRRLLSLRDRLEQALLEMPGVMRNGPAEGRLPNTTNLSFAGTESHALMRALSDKVAVASGSACTSASVEPSYVLKAMGRDDRTANASIRLSLGRFTSMSEVEQTIAWIKVAVKDMRKAKI